MDRQDIHEGEAWRARIEQLIASADILVFVISPRSVASPVCEWEILTAAQLQKRIVPLMKEATPEGSIPNILSELNFVRFDNAPSFMSGMLALRRALTIDVVWIREHTRLLVRAREWESSSRSSNRLLLGPDIEAAKLWLESIPANAPGPTELHREFISSSEQAENERTSQDRQRAQRLQQALRRARVGIAAVSALVLISSALGVLAYLKQQEAVEQANIAKEATARARADQAAAESAKDLAEKAEALAEARRASAEQAKRQADTAIKIIMSGRKLFVPKWAPDELAPDYRHLMEASNYSGAKGASFEVNGELLRRALELNRFVPQPLNGNLVFVVRGATIQDEAEIDAGARQSWNLTDARPDHFFRKSVVLVYNSDKEDIFAFSASSVPSPSAIYDQVRDESRSNLWPTGLYRMSLRTLRAGTSNVRPGVLITERAIPVRRNLDDTTYTTGDAWEVVAVMNPITAQPAPRSLRVDEVEDGAIAGYEFISNGYITLQGEFVREEAGQMYYVGDFDLYRKALGLRDEFSISADNPRFPKSSDDGLSGDIVLLTGLDLALIARSAGGDPSGLDELQRLRFGSKGDEVRRLQTLLGMQQPTGEFDAATLLSYVARQNKLLGWSDGIYSKSAGSKIGICSLADDCP